MRELGRELGLLKSLVGRHPSGPGLAIRVPTRSHLTGWTSFAPPTASISTRSRAGLYDEIWQAFAVLLPVRGVMGDARSYEYVCALRAVTSTMA